MIFFENRGVLKIKKPLKRFFGKINTVLIGFFLLLIFTRFNFLVWENKQSLFQKYNHKIFEKKFNESQYRNPLSKKPIPDYDLYAYAGWEYFHLKNPLTINPEHPPLGKLFIGLATYISGHHQISNVVFFILVCIALVYFSYLLTSSILTTITLILFLLFDKLFTKAFIESPLLDFPQLFFIILFFIFLKLFDEKKEKKYLFLIFITLGVISSIKFWLQGAILTFCLFAFLIIKDIFLSQLSFKKIITYISFLSLTFFTYLLTYFGAFLNKVSLIEVLKAQKWMYNFHKIGIGRFAKDFRGNFLEFIYFNRWKVWYAEKFFYKPYDRYYFGWPIIFTIFFIISLIYIFLLIKKKKINFYFILFLYIWVNLIYLNSFPFYPYYMLPFLPFIYLICFSLNKIFLFKENSK